MAHRRLSVDIPFTQTKAGEMAHVAELREKAKNSAKEAMEEDKERKLEEGRAVRALEAEWQEQREAVST